MIMIALAGPGQNGQFSDSASNHDNDRINTMAAGQFSDSASNHDNDRKNILWPLGRLWPSFHILRAIMIMIG